MKNNSKDQWELFWTKNFQQFQLFSFLWTEMRQNVWEQANVMSKLEFCMKMFDGMWFHGHVEKHLHESIRHAILLVLRKLLPAMETYYIFQLSQTNIASSSMGFRRKKSEKKINLLQSCEFDVCFVEAQRLSMHNNSRWLGGKNVNYLVNAWDVACRTFFPLRKRKLKCFSGSLKSCSPDISQMLPKWNF